MFKIIKNKKILLIAAIFFLFSFLLAHPSTNISYKTFVNDIFKLPFAITSSLLKEIKAIIFYRATLRENESLKKDMTAMKDQIIKCQESIQENGRLRRILSLKTNATFAATVASVIGWDASSWADSLIIDKGSKNRIREGMAVISADGLVGRVQEVGSNSSRVVLISDPNISVAAVLQRSRQEGLVSGTLSDTLIMRYLSKDADAKVGDLVLTSKISSIYPEGVLIGRVYSTGFEPGGLSAFALIKPSVNLTAIEEVMVVLE